MRSPMRLSSWIALLVVSVLFGCSGRGSRGGSPNSGPESGPDPSEGWRLAPGQERALGQALGVGAALPDGCRVLSHEALRTRARATYRCGSMPRPFDIELRHTSTNFLNVVRARSVAIARVDPMGGPDALVAELARRIEALEADLRWIRVAPPVAGLDAGARAPAADVPTAPGGDAPRVDAGDAPLPPPEDAPGSSAEARDASTPPMEAHDAALAPTPAPPATVEPPEPSGGVSNAVLERQGAPRRAGASGWMYQAAPFAEPGGYGSLAPDQFFARLLAWLTDGVLFIGLIALGVLFVLRRQLRESPRWVAPSLGAIALAGFVLRLLIAQDAPMNAFAFQRVLPLASQVMHSPVLSVTSSMTGQTFFLTGVISWTNFALACLTPLALFAHARYLLRDDRSALVAAALIAFLPMHIRFSRSDVQFITSLLSSSLTFVVLYGALTERSRRYAAALFALLPVLSLATYLSRPENIIFAGLDIGAILLYASREVPRRRRHLALALIGLTAAWSVYSNLLAHFAHNVQDGLSIRTLMFAARVLIDRQRNTLLNPSMTPVGVGLLAVIGFVQLWRAGERRRAVFLTTWLGTFFVVHSYVYAEPMMMARYHLHLVSPLILLAAAATPALVRLKPWMRAALFAYVLAWPWIHLRFERDVDFSEMHEMAFLREQRMRVPADCTVLEFVPSTAPSMPEMREASRVGRAGFALRDGAFAPAMQFVSLAEFPAGRRFTARDAEPLTAQARELLAHPPSCLMIYEGLTCRTHLPRGARVAPACAEALGRVHAQAVGQLRFAARRYDDPNVGRLNERPGGGGLMSDPAIVDGEPITLTMWRVTGVR